MHRILAAVDLSDSTQSVLKFSADLARTEDANVAVVYAMPEALPVDALTSSWGMSTVAAEGVGQSDFESSLTQLHQIVKAAGLAVTECLCVRGSAVETIRSAAEQMHADLIVTGSHGHGRLFHSMFGSVHEALISQAPCPVVVVPSHAKPS